MARDIVLVGPSTPMYLEAYVGTGVTAIAGSRWLPDKKDNIFTMVGQVAGIKKLSKLCKS